MELDTIVDGSSFQSVARLKGSPGAYGWEGEKHWPLEVDASEIFDQEKFIYKTKFVGYDPKLSKLYFVRLDIYPFPFYGWFQKRWMSHLYAFKLFEFKLLLTLEVWGIGFHYPGEPYRWTDIAQPKPGKRLRA